MNDYIAAFIVGGIICVIGQILMDTTKLTPGRILVIFVTSGVILQTFNIYEKIVKIGKAGATVPLPGFGYSLAKGVIEEVQKEGFVGIFTGGIKATAGGITGAIVFGYIMALLFNPKTK
ncbi:stage V sporulation protein AE [Clostridium sp. UBA6640]|uniref:stage V sporulation protein AE n=1 Tax=Clostridium sp. UBA6640 TaxID=1946370 RepID=UPI0025BCBB1E|nr:stage V sporulation protein AE [Clostridium sp. UBA6640]